MAFEQWLDFIERKQQVLQRAAYAIGPGRLLATCYRTWRDGVRDAVRERERQRTLELLGDALPQLVRTLLPEVLDGKDLGGLFSGGGADVSHLEAEIAQLKAQLGSADARQEAARQATLGRILRGWKHQHTSRAFDGWKEITAQQKAVLVKSARHWANALLASVWRRWAEMVAEQKEQREGAGRVLGRWRKRAVATAFISWRDTVRAEVDHRNYLLGKVAGRLLNRLLAMTFAPWQELTIRSRGAKELKRRAIMRITHGLISSVYWAWSEYVAAEAAHRHALLAKTQGRLAHKTESVAFQAWVEVVLEARQKREHNFAYALRHLRNHVAAMAFDAWKSFLKWKAQLMSRNLMRLSLGGCAFRSWRAYVRAKQMNLKGAYVLDGLREVGAQWLMGALGDLLPALLPDQSPVGKAMDHELRLIHHSLRWEPDDPNTGMAQTRANMQSQLFALVEDQRSSGGARLLAVARALDSQLARWEAASVNSRRDLDQLREKSSSGMEHLTSELSLLQGYVVEHTKSYLASTATSGSQSKEVEEQLHQLVQTATVFAERLMSVDKQLMNCVDVGYAGELSRQLAQLSSLKAGRQEVQALIDLQKRPSLSVNELKGPYVVVQEASPLRKDGQASLPPAGRGASDTLSGGAGAALTRQRPASASQRMRAAGSGAVGQDAALVGREGVLYRGPSQASGMLQPAPPATPSPRQAGGPRGRPATASSSTASSSALAPTQLYGEQLYEPSLTVSAALAVRERLGAAYSEGRTALLSMEQRLLKQRDAAAFIFAPPYAGDVYAVGMPLAPTGGMHEMRLQWISSMAGSFWAFFDPTAHRGADPGRGGFLPAAAGPGGGAGDGALPSGGAPPIPTVAVPAVPLPGGGAPPPSNVPPPRPPNERPPSELIATQHASIDDLLAEAEATYPGYAEELQQIVYDGHVLWARDLSADLAASGQQQQQQQFAPQSAPGSPRGKKGNVSISEL